MQKVTTSAKYKKILKLNILENFEENRKAVMPFIKDLESNTWRYEHTNNLVSKQPGFM